MQPRVLCLVIDGFEEIETITPVDVLRRAGIEVIMASLTGQIHVTGRSGITMHADAALEGIDVKDFDLLFIPGGPGVKAMRIDGRAAVIARSFANADKAIAAICAAPVVLHDAGLLAGRRYTAHSSVYDELSEALPNERVVQDGDVITSRGAGTALEFGLALVTRLCGEDKAQGVAEAIML